jgi:hypothetical protein
MIYLSKNSIKSNYVFAFILHAMTLDKASLQKSIEGDMFIPRMHVIFFKLFVKQQII